jgi:DNA-binding SARP family transcriptional activator/tetratricopeptide (TPR) repeat protein
VITPRVCLLGEPRLVWESGEVVIGGRPARVFVALLVRVSGTTLDHLAEMVWAGEPPKTARSALHVHLGTLRKLLAQAPPGLTIERQGELYLLRRSGWDLDVELVAERSAKARELLAVGAPDAAVVQLEHALAMWVGEPFTVGGIDVDATATYRHQLVRLDLEEQLAEALLAADEPNRAELLAVQLVESEPYRERRWGQLMRSLAMQGRAGEALGAFERARTLLESDLGVGPGEELRRLERSVLTRTLAPSRAPTPTSPEPDLVDEIPVTLGELIGRADLVELVEATLARRVSVLVFGAPGAGKTRLAVEVARRAAAAGREVKWVDLRNATFDRRLLGSGVARWARQHAGGLVVFDNAEHAIEEVAPIVDECRRTSPSVQVVVTSRARPPGAYAIVTVDPLPVPATDDRRDVERAPAVQMLRSQLAVLAPGVVVDAPTAAALCRQLGGLPLAIRLAADLARSIPVSDIAEVSRARLVRDLAGAVDALLDHLGPDHRRAFAGLSTVAGQLDARLAGTLVGGGDASARVSELVDAGLVQFASGHAAPYSVPEPLRDLGLSMLGDGERADVLDRLCDDCVARAQALALPTGTTPTGHRLDDLLERELPWYRQCVDHLVAIGDDQRALQLVAAADLQLYSLGWWRENIELQDRVLAIPGPPSAARAHVHAIRGRPGQFHQFDEEHNQIALAMADRVGDVACRSRAHYHLAVIRWWEGRYGEALDQLGRARRDAEDAGHAFLVGESRRFTGMVMVSAGRADEGLAIQLGLVERAERVPALELLVPHLCMHLGHSRRHVGDTEAALADLGRARRRFEAMGNRASLVHVCAGLAEVFADLGRFDDALEAAARSLDVSTLSMVDVYDPWTLCTTARVHAERGDDDLARTAAGRAVDALQRTFDGETHRVAVELAWIAARLGEHSAALRLAGLADATPDRRELPFRSPGERERLDEAVVIARRELGAESDALVAAGSGSSVAEAAALLIHRD